MEVTLHLGASYIQDSIRVQFVNTLNQYLITNWYIFCISVAIILENMINLELYCLLKATFKPHVLCISYIIYLHWIEFISGMLSSMN